MPATAAPLPEKLSKKHRRRLKDAGYSPPTTTKNRNETLRQQNLRAYPAGPPRPERHRFAFDEPCRCEQCEGHWCWPQGHVGSKGLSGECFEEITARPNRRHVGGTHSSSAAAFLEIAAARSNGFRIVVETSVPLPGDEPDESRQLFRCAALARKKWECIAAGGAGSQEDWDIRLELNERWQFLGQDSKWWMNRLMAELAEQEERDRADGVAVYIMRADCPAIMDDGELCLGLRKPGELYCADCTRALAPG